MVPVTVHTSIAAPREEIFDFVADLANRVAWMDHCTSELRLAHPDSTGVGAAARYRLLAPRNKQWVETQIVEAERPRRLVEATRGGRLNRSRGEVVFELSKQGRSLTRVEMTVWTEAGSPRERRLESPGAGRNGRGRSPSSACARCSRSAPTRRWRARPWRAGSPRRRLASGSSWWTSRTCIRAPVSARRADRVPPPMRRQRLRSTVLACVLAAAATAATGCQREAEKGEPKREGLGAEVAGLKYNVFITRQINQRLASDRGFYDGPEPKPGFTYYGVFIKVCNETEGFKRPVDHFVVKDSQGNEFEPIEQEADNVFAYHSRRLSKGACVPEAGSPPADGPTGGALLLFEFPVQTLENRPLELEIEETNEEGKVEKQAIELDL
jgi:uncharacterized protein YndB with AHSA1/START domain